MSNGDLGRRQRIAYFPFCYKLHIFDVRIPLALFRNGHSMDKKIHINRQEGVRYGI